MKTIMTRLFTVAVLMMISMAAVADVKVLYGKTGNDTFTGGKISATQEVQKDGQVAVTFTIKPDNGYTFTYTKTSLVIVSVYDPSSIPSTRADEIKVSEPLSVKGTEGTIRYPNSGEYTVTVDPNLGVWVQTVVFTESGTKDDPPVTRSENFFGMFYIANDSKNNDYYKGYDNAENFYLCPAEEYYDNGTVSSDNTKPPFLTTIQHGQADESLWIVEKVTAPDYTGYYTFKQKDGGNYKYLTVNGALTGGYKAHRRRVHLEVRTPLTLTDENYFFIEEKKTDDGGIKGFAISCLDKYKPSNTSNKYLNPPSGNSNSYTSFNNNEKPQSGGIVGFYLLEDKGVLETGSVWFFEVPKPIIQIDGNFKLSFLCANEDVTIHYTIDVGNPSATSTDDIYNENDDIQLTEGLHTIKALAVMNSGYTGYASGVVTYNVKIIGTDSYLIQNVECTDYYMIPGDRDNSNNTTVNTTSLFKPSMAWTFSYAGCEQGTLYYYIKNGTDYLYRTGDNVYMKTDSDFDSSDDGYKFSIEQGYDVDSNPDGFYIIPKGATDVTYCIYKGGWTSTTLANSKSDAIKGSTNARKPEYKHTRWNFISASENKLPASLTYDSSNPADANWPTFLSSSSTTKYFKIENVGAEGYYMNPPEDFTNGFVAATGTSSGGNELAWYVVEASHGEWQKYYYIIHASTGKYMYFTQTIPDNPKTMQGKNQVIALRDYDNSNANLYQFVFAKSTIDGAYYIVPKGLTEATNNNYYALYRDANNPTQPIKSNYNRASDSYKWKFTPSTLFCNNPEFVEEEGVVKIKCNTNAAKIYINTESNDNPNSNSTLYAPTPSTQNWATTDKVRIKAIAIVSDGTTPVSSSVVTLLNKPDITLEESGSGVGDDPYTYAGTAREPGVTSVYIGETIAPTSPTTYEVASYGNNINASTTSNKASVTLTDASDGDVWYIWNASKEFTINKAPLTVTANDNTITYGQEATNDGVEYAGFVNNETTTVLGGTLGYVYSYTQYDDVGNTYTITPNGLTSDNYEISFVAGTLTVEQKEVGLEWTNTTLGYNGSAQAPTATATGTVNNDVIGVTVTLTAQEGSQLTDGNAVEKGSYTATAAGLTGGKAGNYKLPAENTTTFRITNTLLTITANDHSITYGDAPGNNGVTKSDPDAVLSGELTYSYDYEQYGNVGAEYTITPGGVTSNDYEIVFVAGKLTVSQKVLEVEWTNTNLEYSGSEQAPTATFDTDKLVNNDEIGMTVALTAQEGSSLTEEGNAVNAGSYTATATLTGDKAGNYQLSPPTANFNIEQKSMSSSDIKVDITKGSDGNYSVTVKDVKDVETLLNENDENDYTLVADDTNPKYYIVTVTGKNNYKETTTAKFVNVVFSKSDEKDSGWASTFIIDSGEGEFSTPTGFTPHIVTGITSNAVSLTAISYIPEGVPVLLLSDSEANGFVAQAAGDDVLNTSGNLLRIDNAAKNVATAEIYLLYKGEFVLNIEGELPAKRIYLPRTTNAGARLMITNDQSTGIVNLQTDKQEDMDKWYSLDGRRLNGKPTKKGLYIKNGQKAVVK